MAEQNPTELLTRITSGLAASQFELVHRAPPEVYAPPESGIVDRLRSLGSQYEAERVVLTVAFREPTYRLTKLSEGLLWLAEELIGPEQVVERTNFKVWEPTSAVPRLHIGHVTAREVKGMLEVGAVYRPVQEASKRPPKAVAMQSQKIEVARHIRVNLFPDIELAAKYANAPAGVQIPIKNIHQQQALHK